MSQNGGRRHEYRVLLLAVSLLAAFLMAACGSNNNNSGVSVAVTPATASVATGATQQFTATITGNSNTNVTWQVNGTAGGNSTVGTINSSGLYTAPAAVPSPATVTVTAVSQADTTKTASATVTVTAAAAGVSVTISPTTATVAPGATKQFTATVTGNSNTAVTWQVNGTTGGNSTVGTIDTNGLYTAPATAPSPNTVTVAAVSQADSTKSASATVTISSTSSAFSNASLNGVYVFRLQGFNVPPSGTSVSSVLAAGTVTADGNGNITAGEEDLNDGSATQVQKISLTGTYSVSSDGRGTMTLNSSVPTLTLNFVLLADGSARFIINQNALTGFGRMMKQDPNALTAASLAGTYAFHLEGEDTVSSTAGPLVTTGVLTFDANGKITSGTQDINSQGNVSQSVSVSGTYTLVASGGGRATVTLTNSNGTTNYAVYIVSASTLYWVETDFPFPALTGEADRQASGPFTQASVSGDFVFNSSGATSSSQIGRAGKFRLDGNGAVTSGVFDENNGGTIASNVNISGGTYTVSSDGRFQATLTGAGTTITFAGVLVSPNQGFLIGTDTSSTTNGEFFSQRTPKSGGAFSNADLNGAVGGTLSGISGQGPEDLLLQLTADGNGNMTGTLDANNFGTVLNGQAATATYSINSNGRGTMSLKGGGVTRTFAFYLGTGNRVVMVNQDTNELLTGRLLPQS